MPSKPDLTSHNLTNFLDRFVYKNAKTATTVPKGSSIMQPLSHGGNKGTLLLSKTSLAGQPPLNTEAFWQKKAEDVAVDQVFFHRYFNQTGRSKRASTKSAQAGETGDLDDNADEDEDEIWQALVESRPEVEGPSDGDSDMEMLDLDDSDNSSTDWSDALSEVDINSDLQVDGVISEGDEGSDEIADDGDEKDEENLTELFSKEVEIREKKSHQEHDKETSRQRKKRMKNLPTFASVEDYAEMLDNDEDEDI